MSNMSNIISKYTIYREIYFFIFFYIYVYILFFVSFVRPPYFSRVCEEIYVRLNARLMLDLIFFNVRHHPFLI